MKCARELECVGVASRALAVKFHELIEFKPVSASSAREKNLKLAPSPERASEWAGAPERVLFNLLSKL